MHRPVLLFLLVTILSAASLLVTAVPSQSQGGSGQVTITPTDGKVIAWPAAGGGIEESLKPNESVISSAARGHTGFVQTSSRLLGFSTGLRQWRDMSIGVEERIGRHQVLPFLILAHSNQQVFGFKKPAATGPLLRWDRTRQSPSFAAMDMSPSPSPTNGRSDFQPIRMASSRSIGRRMNECSPSMGVRTAWSSAPHHAPSSSNRNRRGGLKYGSHRHPSGPQILHPPFVQFDRIDPGGRGRQRRHRYASLRGNVLQTALIPLLRRVILRASGPSTTRHANRRQSSIAMLSPFSCRRLWD